MNSFARGVASAVVGALVLVNGYSPAQAAGRPIAPLAAVLYDLTLKLASAPPAGPIYVLTDSVRGGLFMTGDTTESDITVIATVSEPALPDVRRLTIERPGPAGPTIHRLVNIRVGEGVEIPGGILLLLAVNEDGVAVQFTDRSAVAGIEPIYRREDNMPKPRS